MRRIAAACETERFFQRLTPMKRLDIYIRGASAVAALVLAGAAVVTCSRSGTPVPSGVVKGPADAPRLEDQVLVGRPKPDNDQLVAAQRPQFEDKALVGPSNSGGEKPAPARQPRIVDEVLIGHSVEQLRERNSVRRLMELEDGQKLSDANGVYGFVVWGIVGKHFKSHRLHGPRDHDFDPNVFREGVDGDLEFHRTSSGETMLLLYVDEGSIVRLAGVNRVGDIFAYYSSHGAHNQLVAVPINRITNWDHTDSYPDFAEVSID